MAFSNVGNLFKGLPTDDAVQHTSYSYILPQTPITKDTTHFEFRIPDNANTFWDITQSLFKIKLRIEKGVLTPGEKPEFDVDANVVPLNNIGQTIWKNHYFRINQHEVGFTPDLQHIRSYWENLIGHTGEKKRTDLEREFWYPDTRDAFQTNKIDDEVKRASRKLSSNKRKKHKSHKRHTTKHHDKDKPYKRRLFEDDDDAGGGGGDDVAQSAPCAADANAATLPFVKNEGFNERVHWTQKGREVTLYCRFHNDLFMQSKFLPAHTEITLIFEKADPKFYIVCDSAAALKKPFIHIMDMELMMCSVKFFDDIQRQFEARLQSNAIQYPLYVTDMLYFDITRGLNTFHERNIFRNTRLPKTVLIGIVETEKILGQYTTNPLELANNTLAEIGFFVNSIPEPLRPIKVDYTRYHPTTPTKIRHAEQAFLTLQTELNLLDSDQSTGIGYRDYLGGYALYAFSLSRTGNKQTNPAVRAAPSEGIVDLYIKFSKPLEKNLRVIMMTKTYGTFYIDKNRKIELRI